MIERPSSARSWVTFVVAFVVADYAVLWAALRLFDDVFEASWIFAANYRTRLLAAFAVSPFIAAFAGTFAASIRTLSFVGLGSDRMTPGRFFAGGWLAILGANWFSVFLACRWALPREVGEKWLHLIGVERFNSVLLLATPTLAYIAGIFAVIGVESIVSAQRM